ncbi:MAG: TonB-dependent receptor domain-containing protein [bacterium]
MNNRLPFLCCRTIILFFLCVPICIYSGESATQARIIGRVIDKSQNTPLADVQIYIRGLRRGDVTNQQGEFLIDRLPVGTYDLTLRLLGYRTIKKYGIVLKANETVELNAAMEVDVLEFEDVVVTATREEEMASEIPRMVSIVDAKTIREKSLSQTPELLRAATGVVVQKTNQGGGSPIIRGLKANKLLFLVDGIRMNNATYRGGNFQYLNTVDATFLERIEVVHGPNSVLYGSDALGGVINVLTQNPQLNRGDGASFKSSVSATLSTADETQTTHATLMAANSKWGVLLHGVYKSFGDIRRGSRGGETLMQRLQNDSRTPRLLNKTQAPNGYNAYALNAKARIVLSEFQELTISAQMDRQIEVPRYDVVEVRKDSIRFFDPQERDLVYLRYTNTHGRTFFNSLTATLSLHRQLEVRKRQRFGSAMETTDRFRTLTPGVQLHFDKLIGRHHLSYGSEIYFDNVSTHSFKRNTRTGDISEKAPLFPDGSSFLNFGFYMQDAFYLHPKWAVNIGGRFSAFRLEAPFSDRFSSVSFGALEQSSTSLTGSLGSQFHLTDAVSFITNVAQGFRTPNLDDVSKLGPGKGSSFFDIPNPDAVPEKSVSVDGGLKIHSSRYNANVVGFYNSLTDVLVRRPATFDGSRFIVEEGDTLHVFRKENAAKAFTTGFALDMQVRIGTNGLLFGNLSYTFGKNVTNAEPLTGVPPFNGLLGLRWSRQRFWSEVNARFAAEQTRLSLEDAEDLRIPEGGTPGWFTLNVRAGIHLFERLALKLALGNVLDRNYREHLSGFNAPGRNFQFGIKLGY